MRTLDHALYSKSLASRISIYEPTEQELSLAKIQKDGPRASKKGPPRKREPVHFDPTLLFSDHRPIWLKIQQKPDQPSDQ